MNGHVFVSMKIAGSIVLLLRHVVVAVNCLGGEQLFGAVCEVFIVDNFIKA